MQGAERGFALFILVAFLVVDAVIGATTIATWSAMDADFFGIWSTAKFLQSHPAPDVYDITQLGAFQHGLRPRFAAIFPAPYSPVFLLAIRPLAWMSYTMAHLAWVGVTFGAFVWAGHAALRRPNLTAILLAAPVVALNMVYGQTGFLTAALMIGFLCAMGTRPWLAGLCLAMLAFKPQLGLLMPVVLLARGDWKTFATTIIWLAGLIALSSAVLGWSIWPDWFTTLASHGALMTESREQLIGIMATVTSAVLSLGGDPQLARIIQLVVAVVIAAVVWIAWRRDDRTLATIATMVGTFMITPYAFVYDTPVAMCAALLFLRYCGDQPEGLSGLELGAVVFVLFAPLVILAATPQPPAAPVSLLVLFAVVARRIFAPGFARD